MTLPYKYPDGRESRHVRYKFSSWGTSVGVFDLSLQYRTKGWWRYRWHTVSSLAYYPMGEKPLDAYFGQLLKRVEQYRHERNYERRRMMRHRKFLKHLLSLNSE